MQTDTAADYHELADAMEALANQLRDADSIANDCPVLSELFHTVRTSPYKSRRGSHVALLDYDPDEGWSCRSVSFLEQGTHYRDTGADLSVSFQPYPFISVDEFGMHISDTIKRDARATRQTAGNLEAAKRVEEQQKEYRR